MKRGYKLWVRAGMDGYISNFDIYQGKNGCAIPEVYELHERVALNMTGDLKMKHYKIYFDYYSPLGN